MIYYIIIALPIIFYLTRLLLTNYIVPYYKKKALYQQMQQRQDWGNIESKHDFLKNLFRRDFAKLTSTIHRKWHFNTNQEFVYGEIDLLSFYTILELAQPNPGEVFYDLGSGAGKAIFSAALYFDFSKCCGIELLEPLYNKARKKLRIASTTEYQQKVTCIQFVNDNFLDYDFSDANIIYIAATCLSDATWEKLINKLAQLKSGTRIIVASKSIQHQGFALMYQGIDLMSWGLCPVAIYKITH